MKLLGRSQFESMPSWISPECISTKKNVHFRARYRAARESLGNGVLLIAAESFYVVYVNGEFVGKGPARGTYTCNFLDRYNISQYLCNNDNSIAIELFCNNYPTFISSPAEPGLFVQIGEVISDETWEVQIASDWREDVPKYTLQIGSMEWRDMSREPLGWKTFEDNSSWTSASVISSDRPIYSKALYLRDVCNLKVTRIMPVDVPVVASVGPEFECEPNKLAEFISNEQFAEYPGGVDVNAILSGKAVEIKSLTTGDGVALILDFGQAIIGEFNIDVDASADVIMDVSYDEYIDGGKLVPARTHYKFADRYVLREGRQVVSNPLHWRGGRYVQLIFRKLHAPITINKITFTDSRYPLTSPAEFMCNDETLNILWDKCTATMSACATDTFLDCPWREMSFWVNDFVVQHEFWQQLVGQQDIVRRSLSLALSQPASDGLIPGVCPSDGSNHFVLFPTNLFLPLILRDFEKYSDDKGYVNEALSEIENIFINCQKYRNNSDLLEPPQQYWNFTDWSYYLSKQFPQKSSGEYPLQSENTCIVNWFNCLAAKSLSELYENRDAEKSQTYRKLAEQIGSAIIEKFWNIDLNCFNEILGRKGVASKITHALALLSELLPENLVDSCVKALYRDDCLTPELYMMHYVFKALALTGRHDEVLRLIKRYWQPIVESDCPTIWEANVYEHAKKAFWNAGSLCHAFALAPVSFLQQEVLGVKPIGNGFKAFSVLPNDIGLQSARGTINTPNGNIKVEWQKISDGFAMNIFVPENSKAILSNGTELASGSHKFHYRPFEKYECTMCRINIL